MPDQWDPKYPKENPARGWQKLYEKANTDLESRSASRWRPAFEAIVTAYCNEEFIHLQRFHDETKRKHPNKWVWRWGLWVLHCWPIFEKPDDPQAPWPTYASNALAAIPNTWLTENPKLPAGKTDGVPRKWFEAHNNRNGWKTVWAFKVTTVLIAGLIEGELSKELVDEEICFGHEAVHAQRRLRRG